MVEGHHGIIPPGPRPDYKAYRSPHAPSYTISPNVRGINATRFLRFGRAAAMFGAVAGVAGTFFLSDVPRFRMDVMEKLPFVGGYFHKDIPPEDNPF